MQFLWSEAQTIKNIVPFIQYPTSRLACWKQARRKNARHRFKKLQFRNYTYVEASWKALAMSLKRGEKSDILPIHTNQTLIYLFPFNFGSGQKKWIQFRHRGKKWNRFRQRCTWTTASEISLVKVHCRFDFVIFQLTSFFQNSWLWIIPSSTYLF